VAVDSKGHIWVVDRCGQNSCADSNLDPIMEFDANGTFVKAFGGGLFNFPHGFYIDKNDILYSTDSESRSPMGYGYHPGWKRGIRIGSVKDGIVTAFIPDPTPDPDKYATSGGEGIWVDVHGAVYSAQVKQKAIVKYVKQ
jgi:hypothetical protein